MFRKDYEKIQDQCVNILKKIADRALRAELHYVVCFWESPFRSGIIEHRVGYFENTSEAEIFSNMLADKYQKRNADFYITSNIVEDMDGGLFDD